MENEQHQRILAGSIVLALVALVVGFFLWMVFANYIEPSTATERKDVVNMLILSAAALVGSVTAIVAVGNLRISRSNLEQQRELDERRGQDDALQDYFTQMGGLLTEHGLAKKSKDEPERLLARAHTLTVLRRLEGSPRRKTNVVLFLEGAGLIKRENPLVDLNGADLDEADLSDTALNRTNFNGVYLNNATVTDTRLVEADLTGAYLVRTNLSGAFLRMSVLRDAFLNDAILVEADLTGADLRGAALLDADLSDAILSGADLSGAFLRGTKVEQTQLDQVKSLAGAVMPDGTEHP